MSKKQESIKRIFANLLEEEGDPGQRVRVRVDVQSPISIYAARTFPSRNTVLEIGPIKKAYLPQGFTRPRIKGLDITLDGKQKAGGGAVTLLLELMIPDSLDVFITFVARICEALDSLSDPADAVRCVIAIIDRWKNFFAGNSELLNEGRQTGLYGELYLMLSLYKSKVLLGNLVHAWTGSRRTNQDYEFGVISIEVKSSAAVDATSVSITNIRQLDDAGLKSLYLSRITFDARQGTSNTLPILVNYLREEIVNNSPEVILEFEEKLLLANYRDDHKEHYANRSYSERVIEFYDVCQGFPRLIERDLPDGITKASYDITLEKCKSFIRPRDEICEAVRNCCD